MNALTKFLVEGLLDNQKTVAIYGGGFKPPTKGHFTVAQDAIKELPQVDEFKIFVGSGVRDGITQDESVKIWSIYKKYLASKIKIEPVQSPVKSVLDYSKQNPDVKVYWVLGVRDGNEDDLIDAKNRTKSLDRYPNIEVKVITTVGGISGTKARQAIRDNNQELFNTLIPKVNDNEKQQIWDMVSPIIKENIESNLEEIWNPEEYFVSLCKYMIDNGMNIRPLPKIKVIKDDKQNASDLLGKTAYYNPNDKSITLFTMNRHPKDVMRSFCHEIIHHIQNLEGRLNNITTTNTNQDSNLVELEKEAYLKGNMMFRNWEDSMKDNKYLNEVFEKDLYYWQNLDINSNPPFIDIPKFNYKKTLTENLWHTLNEITLSKDNAVKINGDLTGGNFKVGDITYNYNIVNLINPYSNDLGKFYNIQFTPEENITSNPQGGKENYIKILSTMFKIISDFAEKEKPEYIGIASMDNDGSKNYHKVYNNLTDNKYNNIPGYFRKDVSLKFNSSEGKGQFVVLKRKNV